MRLVAVVDDKGSKHVETARYGLVHAQGVGVLVPLIVPVAIALMPFLVKGKAARIVAGLLLLGFCVIGIASIGLLYLPSALVMLAASVTK